MSQGQLIGLLNREAHAGDTVVAAAGGPPGDLLKLWDATGGRRCHLEFGYSCMGYEIPAGLGVRMAQPEGEVFVLIGDGTYLMNPTELVTAVQEGLKITVDRLGKPWLSVHPPAPDVAYWQSASATNSARRDPASQPARGRLSSSWTWPPMPRASAPGPGTSTTTEQFAQALREARAETRTCVIVAEIEKHRVLPGGGCWWDVAPAEVSQDPKTQELRAEFERDRAQFQRLHY